MASFTFFVLFLSLSSFSTQSFSLDLRRSISYQSSGHYILSTSDRDRYSSSAAAGEDIHDLLPLYGFPKGLLPDSVKSYTLSDDGTFTVEFRSHCYVHFPDQLVFYDKKISGKFSYGSVKDVEGIQAKEAFFWVPITAMESDQSSGTIVFSVGFVSKTLPASMFQNILSCERKQVLQEITDS